VAVVVLLVPLVRLMPGWALGALRLFQAGWESAGEDQSPVPSGHQWRLGRHVDRCNDPRLARDFQVPDDSRAAMSPTRGPRFLPEGLSQPGRACLTE